MTLELFLAGLAMLAAAGWLATGCGIAYGIVVLWRQGRYSPPGWTLPFVVPLFLVAWPLLACVVAGYEGAVNG